MKKVHKIMILSALLFTACSGSEVDYYPKPNGYIRLDFPERVYTVYDSPCPYSFEMPEYFSVIDKDSMCNKKDIQMDRFNATLNLTYLPVDTNLSFLIEKSRSLAYEHAIFADAIEEELIIDPSRRAFGLRYKIVGDAASPFQFYLTDSTDHFLRGALYFNVKPNYDSIRPSLDYVTEDLDRMLQTVTWKKDSLIDQ